MRFTCPVILIAAIAVASESAAAADRPASFHAAILQSPAIQAALHRVDSARRGSEAAGLFPDAELEAMYTQVDKPTESFPMWEIGIRQPLPRMGERAAQRELAGARVAIAEAELAVRAGELALQVAAQLIEEDAARARAALLSAQIERIRNLLQAAEARIGTDQAGIGEILRLQAQMDELQLMAQVEQQRADNSRDQCRALLGLRKGEALPTRPTAPALSHDNTDNGLLELTEMRGAEAAAKEQLARARLRPMASIGLRFEREEERMGPVDKVGIGLMFDIPWRGRQQSLAEIAAARAETLANRSDAEAVRMRVGALRDRAARGDELAAFAQSLADTSRARLDAESGSIIESLGTDRPRYESGLNRMVDLIEADTRAQLRAIEARTSAELTHAEMWRYAPSHLFLQGRIPQPHYLRE